MERFGLGDRWTYRFPITGRWFGLSGAERRAEVLASADLLINVSGTLEDPEDYRRIPRLAYIDSDPVFTQVKLLADRRARSRAGWTRTTRTSASERGSARGPRDALRVEADPAAGRAVRVVARRPPRARRSRP